MRRGVEFASALLLVVGTTFGCAKQTSTLEFNTQARATETAQWQNSNPHAIYLGSVIITPDLGLNVRSAPSVHFSDPDNKIAWENIISIDDLLLVKGKKFSIKYPTLVYGPDVVDSLDFTLANNAPWIQLDAQVKSNGKISNQKVYISFSDDPRRSYMETEYSDSRISRLISPVRGVADGLLINSTGQTIPKSEVNQISICNSDNPCIIPKNERDTLAHNRFLQRIATLLYKYSLIQGDGLSPDNPTYFGNFFVNKDNYLRFGQNKIPMPLSFVLRSENDSIQIALSEAFIKDTVVLLGRDIGGDVTLCALNSPEKTQAYRDLLESFSQNSIVDRRLLLTLAEGATSCVTH